ncbi:MAG TPA: hypothetical protein VIV58_00975, partial [Kofleriaceae bacterium]
TNTALLGPDGRPVSSETADLEAQSAEVAFAFRAWYQRGFERVNMLRSIAAGLCFFGDNFGVSRETLIEMIKATQLRSDREFTIKP